MTSLRMFHQRKFPHKNIGKKNSLIAGKKSAQSKKYP